MFVRSSVLPRRRAEPSSAAMNVFCAILGHTWVHKSETPKMSWNNDKEGLLLSAYPHGDVVFYEECARCRSRRNERRIAVERKERPRMDGEDEEAEPSAQAS